MNKKVVALCGAASCGKTTTAYALRNALINDYVVEIVPEYARIHLLDDKIDKSCRYACALQQINIFWNQADKEKSIIENKNIDYVICECPLFLNYLYSIQTIDEVNLLMRFCKCALECLHCYTHIYYLPIFNTSFKDDVVRSAAKQYRQKIDYAIRGFLEMHNVNYTIIDCEKTKRADMILGDLV